MRIVLVCNDTLGGVRPYAALGAGLKHAGHDVVAVAPAAHAGLFAAAGIPVTRLAGTDVDDLAGSTTIAERGTLATMRYMARKLPERLAVWTRQTLAASEGADCLAGGVGGMVIGSAVAEALRIPFVAAQLQPVGASTDAFPGVLLSWLPHWLGPHSRRASHALSDAMVTLPFRQARRRVRRDVLKLHGAPRHIAGTPALYGFSSAVVSLPSTSGRPSLVTGYWELDDAPAPPFAPTVEAWLAGAGIGIAIGFGSMATNDAAALLALLDEAMALIDARAVVGGLAVGDVPTPASQRLLLLPPAPHRWLFPLVDFVVHHGGAGTTGAAFRAGRPQVVVPFAVDQPFWARRTVTLGVSPGFVPRRALSARHLAEMLGRATRDPCFGVAARGIASRIAEEDGVARAVEALDRIV